MFPYTTHVECMTFNFSSNVDLDIEKLHLQSLVFVCNNWGQFNLGVFFSFGLSVLNQAELPVSYC